MPYVIEDASRIPESLTGEPGDPARGRALYEAPMRGGCTACHATLPGEGLTAAEIRLWIVAPAVADPGTEMPPYFAAGYREAVDDPLHGGPRLTAGEIEDLVAYLAGLEERAPGGRR